MLELLWLCLAAYVVVQIVVLVVCSGSMRWAAAAPLLLTVPLGVWTGIALSQDSNLWPVPLLLTAPVALLYVAAVGAVRLASRGGAPKV